MTKPIDLLSASLRASVLEYGEPALNEWLARVDADIAAEPFNTPGYNAETARILRDAIAERLESLSPAHRAETAAYALEEVRKAAREFEAVLLSHRQALRGIPELRSLERDLNYILSSNPSALLPKAAQ